MKYLKSVLAGAAALAVSMMISGVAAIAVITRFPGIAARIFPAQHYDLQWGAAYYVNFPIWPIVMVSLLGFIIAFAWTTLGRHPRSNRA